MSSALYSRFSFLLPSRKKRNDKSRWRKSASDAKRKEQKESAKSVSPEKKKRKSGSRKKKKKMLSGSKKGSNRKPNARLPERFLSRWMTSSGLIPLLNRQLKLILVPLSLALEFIQ